MSPYPRQFTVPSRLRPRPVSPKAHLLLRALEDRVAPATFTVTNTGDAGAGSGASGDLRYCITQANLDGNNPDIIGFSNTTAGGATNFFDGFPHSIALASALPAITNPLTISGPGATSLTVAATGTFPIFTTQAAAGQTVTVGGMTIDGGGTATYGVNESGGNLTVSGAIVQGNHTAGVNENTSGTNLTISNSTIRNNAGGIADFYAGNVIVVTNSTIANNSGLGISNRGGSGGLTITGCTVSGNGGGGVRWGTYNANVTLTISNSTIANNSATDGGGIYVDFINSASVSISNSTVANNTAINGAGIEVTGYGGSVALTSDTIIGNTATNANVIPGSGGAIALPPASKYPVISLDSTIVAGNSSTNGFNDISAASALSPMGQSTAIVAAKYTAIGSTAGFPLTDQGHNLIGANLLLGPVQNNGGSVPTAALVAGSPAIDAGDPALGGTTDDRGVTRPQGSGVDIGAYERTASTIGASAALTNVSSLNASPTYQFTVTYADDVPINPGQISSSNVTISAPAGVTPPAVSLAALDSSNPNRLIATYQFTAPGGAWTAADNGGYTVVMTPSQVGDVNGSIPGGPLATFTVSVPMVLTVTNTGDTTAIGSLRAAITAANAVAPAPALIVFSNTTTGGATNFYDGTSYTISLTSTLPTIVTSVSIVGPGSGLLTIRPTAGGSFQLLPIHPSSATGDATAVQLSGLTLTGGKTNTSGGAISDGYAALTLTDVTISGNSAAFGGGIYVQYNTAPAVTLINCAIQCNTSGFGGGGIGFGGAGLLSMTGCMIAGNRAAADGGGVDMRGFAPGYVTVTQTTITNNSAGGSGGGVALGQETFRPRGNTYGLSINLLIDRSTISGNIASGTGPGGGGIYLAGAVGGNGATILNSTIANNTAFNGGGLAAATLYGKLAVNSSTITGNTATSTLSTPAGRGGGGIGLYVGYHGYLGGNYSAIALDNTIVSGNGAGNAYKDIAKVADSTVTLSAKYSAIGTTSGYALSDLGGNLSAANSTPAALQLGSLGRYGGATASMLLGAGSTARDHGDPALAGTTDQRGIARPLGAGVDIGAFERAPGIPTATASVHAVTAPTEPGTYQFNVVYSDDAAMQYASINGNASAVTVTPPPGLPAVNVSFVSATPAANASTITATYQFTVPGGSWSVADNGAWTVNLAANQVANGNSVFVPARPIGSIPVLVPRTITVTNLNDAGPGSLRQALTDAPADAPAADNIVFAPGLAGTITLSSGSLTITNSLSLIGLVGNGIAINGNNAGPVISVGAGASPVLIKNLEITGGSTTAFGVSGGGVFAGANNVTLDTDWIHGNRAIYGGGIGGSSGAFLTVKNSAVTGNTAANYGGGLYGSIDYGPTHILVQNTTISGNSAQYGGGIGIRTPDEENTARPDEGFVSVHNSTITGNTGYSGGGIAEYAGQASVSVDLVSSIVSGNTAFTGGPDFSAPAVSASYSALGSAGGITTFTNRGNNLPIGANLGLLPLGNNGGPTPTCALFAGSPAINQGSNPDGLSTDQRGPGYPRESPAGLPDIGAYELAISGIGNGTPVVVTTAADSGPGSLRDAITQANSAGAGTFDAIVFSNTTAGGAVNFSDGAVHTISLLSALPQITHAVSITGPGSNLLTVRRDPSAVQFRVFDLNALAALTGLTVSGGSLPSDTGAGVLARQTAILTDVALRNNSATSGGGGIATRGTSAVSLVNCSISGNGTGLGGGIYAVGPSTVSLTNCVVSGNAGGGIFDYSASLIVTGSTIVNNRDDGGIIVFSSGRLQVVGSTISGNTSDVGAGLYILDDGTLDSATVSNCTIANNTATSGGGLVVGFSSQGALKVQNCTITGNSATATTTGTTTADGGGGIRLYRSNATVALDGCIISGNHASNGRSDIVTDSMGSITTAYSAISNTTGFTYAPGPRDLPIGVNLNLLPLANNGGPTQTIALGQGSSALDHGDPNTGLATDQRGYARVYGPAPDIGAYEAQPFTVAGVQVNDGSAQRSEVRSIQVTFSGPVTFAGGNAAAAFQLLHVQTGNNVILSATTTTDALGRTVVTLGFSGGETDPVSALNGGLPSLADGRYQLTILGADVTGPDGLALAGDGTNAGSNYFSPADTYEGNGLHLYRLFADVNGDGVVDATDVGQLKFAFNTGVGNPLYLSCLDADNSGAVDAQDIGQFKSRFNTNVFG
jgi:hypothetical protein